jgi:O-methyltransferase
MLRSIRRSALANAKGVLTRTGLRRFLLPKYRYMFSPEQLWALCEAAEAAFSLGGAFAEIGVFDGGTTVYLHRHLQGKGEPPIYYCIDTFSGFTDEDIQVERERGKTTDYKDLFYYNSKECFLRTMKLNGIDRTVVIQADAATFDYSTLPPLSFALLDVDLLRPMRVAMAGCWDKLLPGGIMVIDDCDPSISAFDGALEAYGEFCKERGLPVDIRHGKLGFASKPAVSSN